MAHGLWCSKGKTSKNIWKTMSPSRNHDPITQFHPQTLWANSYRHYFLFPPRRRKPAPTHEKLDFIFYSWPNLLNIRNVYIWPVTSPRLSSARETRGRKKIVPSWNCSPQGGVWIIFSHQVVISGTRHRCCSCVFLSPACQSAYYILEKADVSPVDITGKKKHVWGCELSL